MPPLERKPSSNAEPYEETGAAHGYSTPMGTSNLQKLSTIVQRAFPQDGRILGTAAPWTASMVPSTSMPAMLHHQSMSTPDHWRLMPSANVSNAVPLAYYSAVMQSAGQQMSVGQQMVPMLMHLSHGYMGASPNMVMPASMMGVLGVTPTMSAQQHTAPPSGSLTKGVMLNGTMMPSTVQHVLRTRHTGRTARTRMYSTQQPSRKCACPYCGKLFVSKSKVDRHLTVHTGKRPWECSVCHSRFTQKGALKIHLRRHERCAQGHAARVLATAKEKSNGVTAGAQATSQPPLARGNESDSNDSARSDISTPNCAPDTSMLYDNKSIASSASDGGPRHTSAPARDSVARMVRRAASLPADHDGDSTVTDTDTDSDAEAKV